MNTLNQVLLMSFVMTLIAAWVFYRVAYVKVEKTCTSQGCRVNTQSYLVAAGLQLTAVLATSGTALVLTIREAAATDIELQALTLNFSLSVLFAAIVMAVVTFFNMWLLREKRLPETHKLTSTIALGLGLVIVFLAFLAVQSALLAFV